MNSVSLIGRLVEDPAVRTTLMGVPECSMRVAVPRVDSAGAPEPGVVYVDVVARGPRAEELGDELCGGARVGVAGRLELEEWVAPDGDPRTRHEVIADQLELLDPPPSSPLGSPGARG